MSFSQEMLRFLQPELLQPEEMIDILIKRGVNLSQLKHLDRSTLLDIFRNTAVPKPQRKKHGPHSCNSSSASKIKNRIVLTSENDRSSASDSRRHSSSDYREKHSITGPDRLKPPPDLSKSRDYSGLDRSQNSSRLRPPPDLSQPESKKIKLNRSASESLNNIIINDRSRNHCSSDHSSKIKSSRTNGSNERSISEEVKFCGFSEKKDTALKRNFESSQPADGPPKKRQPITWP